MVSSSLSQLRSSAWASRTKSYSVTSGVRRNEPLYHVDKGGLSASVYANKADMIPRPDLKGYVGKKNPFGELLPYLYNIHDRHTFTNAV